MKNLFIAASVLLFSGCATLTNDAMVPVAFSFSDGSTGSCVFENKRGRWQVDIPGTPDIRRSDDPLKYQCESEHGGNAVGAIPSTMGGEIAVSAIFLDFGITDAITDMHRDYPASFVIPMSNDAPKQGTQEKYTTQVKTIADSMRCDKGARMLSATEESEKWVLYCGDGETLGVRCFEENCYVK